MSLKIEINNLLRDSGLNLSLMELMYKTGGKQGTITSILKRLKEEGFVKNLGKVKSVINRVGGIAREISLVLWGHTGRKSTPTVKTKDSNHEQDILKFISNQRVFFTTRDIADGLSLSMIQASWGAKNLSEKGEIKARKGYDLVLRRKVNIFYFGPVPNETYNNNIQIEEVPVRAKKGEKIIKILTKKKSYEMGNSPLFDHMQGLAL
jgi:hypothetical protein